MRKLNGFIFVLIFSLFSCKKEDSTQPAVAGHWIWTIEYTNNPLYNSTPQTRGINETLDFTNNGTFSLTQNNVIVNSGTYRTSSFTAPNGDVVSSILYTNMRVTDSVGYYKLNNANDSLFFSFDLIGSVGASERHYVRQ